MYVGKSAVTVPTDPGVTAPVDPGTTAPIDPTVPVDPGATTEPPVVEMERPGWLDTGLD